MQVLLPAISQLIPVPAGRTASPTDFQYIPESNCFVFDDGQTVYGRTPNGLARFTISPQMNLLGWAAIGPNLYLQDGSVLCEYDINGLKTNNSPLPENAVNLRTHHSWSNQDWGSQNADPSGFLALFPEDKTPDHSFAKPAVANYGDGNPWILVLTSLTAPPHVRAIPFASNLAHGQVYRTEQVPDSPLAAFAINVAGQLCLQYSEDNQMVTLARMPLERQSKLTPASGTELWLRLSRAGARQFAAQAASSHRIEVPESAWTATVCAGSQTSPWQLYVLEATAAAQQPAMIACVANSGEVTGGQLGNSQSQRMLLAPPFARLEDGAMTMYGVTQDGSGQVFFEQYKLADALAGPASDARTLIGSQMTGIAPWLAGTSIGSSGPAMGADIPFDSDASLICLAAILEVFAITDPGIAAKLASAVSAAARSMIRIAAGSDSVQVVTSTLNRLASIPQASAFAWFYELGYLPERVMGLMRAIFSSAGRDVVALLRAKGHTEAELASALYRNEYGAVELLFGLDAQNEWAWQGPQVTGSPGYFSVPDNLKPLSNALPAAGYTSDQVASSFLTSRMAKVAAAVFLSSYTNLSAYDAKDTLYRARPSFPDDDASFVNLVREAIWDYYGIAV
ncbi:MAG TPA: hypothetical protein VKB38_19255 [Terracidiphilus sp.]|nr:hypothetical protein [Terracidiphilus sp.]